MTSSAVFGQICSETLTKYSQPPFPILGTLKEGKQSKIVF